MTSNAIEFYQRLSGIYDELFPADNGTVQFLVESGAAPESRALDLACGTGLYTEALAARGVSCVGVDGSPDLIAIARARRTHPERFVLADMRDLRPEGPPSQGGIPAGTAGETGAGAAIAGPFDLVFCIGNSLSHLESREEARQVVLAMAGLTRIRSGRVVLQDVDMEVIPVGGVRQLPSLTVGEVTFERCYRRETADRVVFDASLTDESTGTALALKNELLVLRTADLVGWLAEAGLTAVDVWGGFSRQPSEGSWVRVVRGEAGR